VDNEELKGSIVFIFTWREIVHRVCLRIMPSSMDIIVVLLSMDHIALLFVEM